MDFLDIPSSCAFFILPKPAADLFITTIKGGKNMDFVEVRTIDDLGRIVVPKDVRDVMDWEQGTKIAIYLCDDAVVLKEDNCDRD